MDRRHVFALVFGLLFLGLLLNGCKKAAPEPGATATPTRQPTEEPTSTPTREAATPTPLPGYTPLPPGSVPPQIIERVPERGEELGLDQPIRLVFDQPMDHRSVESALVVSVDGGDQVEGQYEWESDQVVSFRARGLARDTRYHVYLGQAAKSQEGNR
jgi:hypothetical protein